jgi:hypothetical protein
MGNPNPKEPLAPTTQTGHFDTSSPEMGTCMAPPAFGLEASGGLSECDPSIVSEFGQCVEGEVDSMQEAYNTAYSGGNSWSKKALGKIEGVLIAARNILNNNTCEMPTEGSLGHPSAYESWGLTKEHKKALWELYRALYESDTIDIKAKHLKAGKAGIKSAVDQIKAFKKSKTFAKLPGFQDLAQAVEEGITAKIDVMQAGIDALKPKKSSGKGGGGGAGGSSKGFNRTAITDFTQLPGLEVDTEAVAPAEGSLAATVEANMQRDLVIESANVEDFLYVNIPDIISGTAKSKKAMAMWKQIKNYRDKHLTEVFGAHVTKPDDPVAQQAYEAALQAMEVTLGPEIRKIAKSLWYIDPAFAGTLNTEAGALHGDLDTLHTSLETATAVAGFDAATLDVANFKSAAEGIKDRIAKFFSDADDLGLSDDDAGKIRNPAVKALRTMKSVVKSLGAKKLSTKTIESVKDGLVKAAEQMKTAQAEMEALTTKIEARNKANKYITDHIEDPTKVPLVKPVKRHNVSVTFKGDGPDAEVKASYNTKPESMIGIYENVWSPKSISDKAGNFDRPGGAKRGAKVYEELKTEGFTESEAKILGSVSTGEGDFHSLNSVDVMRISLGFIQFAGASFTALLEDLKKQDPTYFQDHFEQYGILINNGEKSIPAVTRRDTRFVPGAEHHKPKEEDNKTNNKLVVYDHKSRVWVNGAEALAVLQSDPRYLTLIQSSGSNRSMELAQIKRAKDKYHNATRLGRIKYKSVGLEAPDGDKNATFQVRDVFKNELCAYGSTAWGIAAGPSNGVDLAEDVIEDIVKSKKLKTLAELQAVSQSEMTIFFKKHYEKWDRPTKFGEETGKPLSDSVYDGTY